MNGFVDPVRSDMQLKESGGRKGATVVIGGGELLSLTTILSLNASCLMEASGRRFKEFAILVRGLKEKPDIIVVTELGGYSGVVSIQSKMHGPLAGYGVASSQRPQGSGKKQAGAGVLLLYKREKFRCEDLPLPDVSQRPLLSGYVRSFCLWRKQTPSVPPLVVTVAYIPPELAYIHDLRMEALKVLPKIVEEVKRVRCGSQQILVAHVNAADGCIDLPTSLSKVISMSDIATTLKPSETPFEVMGKVGMRLVRHPDGSVTHQRQKIKAVSKTSPQGRTLSLGMAKAGMLPCMGVSENIRPSTCEKCKVRCAHLEFCVCKRSRLSGQNDVIFVPQEDLYRGIGKDMKSTVRRVRWSRQIEHSLLTLTLPTYGKKSEPIPVERVKSVVRRFKLPAELLRRATILSCIALAQDTALHDNPTLEAAASWPYVQPQFACGQKMEGTLSSDEIAAAFRSSPKDYWRHQASLERDVGSSAIASSACLLNSIHEDNGNVITLDPNETAGMILQHRRHMSQIPAELPLDVEIVYQALDDVAWHNSRVEGLAPTSVGALTALEPDHFWKNSEERRWNASPMGVSEYVSGYQRWRRYSPDRVDTTTASYLKVQGSHALACGKLNVPIRMEEVKAALGRLQDVGAGMDNVPPIVFGMHSTHTDCSVLKALTLEFNSVMITGLVPATWLKHRMLLHYKEHDAHPGALDSYRALGIGSCPLKIMSMVMEERLNEFLTETGALSREQLGFKRKSGTSEAVLAVSEIIRNASKEQPVLAAFVDVRAAYDSVIREVLYAKMLKMGIGGNFLTTIQAFFTSMTAELEVGGSMIGTVDLEVGLCQGSPLSPILFNIYINSCITGLVEEADEHSRVTDGVMKGVYLPSATDDVVRTNRIKSIWYADDSILLEHDIVRLQWMLNTLTRLLRDIGLTINVRKTKLMVTAKCGIPFVRPVDPVLLVGGAVVSVVQEFLYLGTMFNSRGDWGAAWKKAHKSASLAYHEAVVGGLFTHSGSMSSMLTFARAKIWSHYDSLMAVTGAGGTKTSAFYKVADQNINNVLRMIVGHANWNTKALRIESGIWDTVSRADMLMLRFLTKICSSDPESLVSRAVRMSMANITDNDLSVLETKHQRKDVVHKQSWAQQVLAAASRLHIPLGEVKAMRPGILLTIQEERIVDGDRVWECVPFPATYVLGDLKARIAMRERPLDGLYVEGEHAWAVHRSDAPTNQPLFQQWSEPLRLGYHAAIRKQGNRSRQAKVKEFIQDSIAQDTNVAGWASVHGFASYMPMYWHVHDIGHARAMARIAMDTAWNEGAQRRRPVMPKQLDGSVVLRIPRIKDRTLRACYLCDELLGRPGVFESESLYHMLMNCPHVSMKELRECLENDVKNLCQMDADYELPEPPEFTDNSFGLSEMWAVMMLCTSAASFPLDLPSHADLQYVEDPTEAAKIIRARPVYYVRGGVVQASRWVYAVMEAWRSKLRDYHVPGEASAMTGAKLAALVCKHMRAVCRLRRRLLKNNVEYSKRSRDPPPSENDGLAPGTDGIHGGDASLAPTGFRAMERNELHWLCKQKGFKANGSNKSMVAALQASMCSDMTAIGGGRAADDGGDGMILDFKSLTCEELKLLRKQKPGANDTSVNMANALEAFRCSAVAAVADGSAAEDDDEDVEDDED